MLIPLTHERMTVQRLPWVTIVIIGLNFLVFALTWPRAQRDSARTAEAWEELYGYAEDHPGIWEDDCELCPGRLEFDELRERYHSSHAEHVFSRYGYVPASPTLRGLLGSLFLHAGWWHLLWNMYFLWLYGCSIEDLWGRPLYALVYVAGGAAAALAQGAYEPDNLGHLVGASGAIAALTGVFFVRCHDTRIRFFWTFLILFGTFHAPAWIMLLFWLLKELFYAFVYADSSSVAFWAHIGGFAFGAIVASLVKLTRLEETVIAPAIDRKTNLVGRHASASKAMELIDDGDLEGATSQLRIAIREDPADADLYRLLAQCYQSLDKPFDAARWLRQELKLHAMAREDALEAETYQELASTVPELALTPRERASAARALMSTGNEDIGVPLLRELLEDAPEPLLRLRAGLALVDFFHREGDGRRAFAVLDRIQELVDVHPEWQALVEGRRSAIANR